MPATIWRQGMQQALACTIRDTSAGGALLEFPQVRLGEEAASLAVGDKITLSFHTPQERTTVACLVARVDGRRVGVRFCGQFRNEPLKKKAVSKDDKPAAKKGLLGILRT